MVFDGFLLDGLLLDGLLLDRSGLSRAFGVKVLGRRGGDCILGNRLCIRRGGVRLVPRIAAVQGACRGTPSCLGRS